jgi:hypothetical protein
MGEIEPHDPGTLLGYEDELTFDGVPGVAYDLDNELDVELAMVMQT